MTWWPVMTEGRRYAVIRGTDTDADGTWYDLSSMDEIEGAGGIVFTPTLRFERREDGMSARVYTPEVR